MDRSLEQKMRGWEHKPAHKYRAATCTSIRTLSLLFFTHHHVQCKINTDGRAVNE